MTHYKPETSLAHPTEVTFEDRRTERFHGVPGEDVTSTDTTTVHTERFHGNHHQIEGRRADRRRFATGAVLATLAVGSLAFGAGRFSERYLGDDPSEIVGNQGQDEDSPIIESSLTRAELTDSEAIVAFDQEGYAVDVNGNRYIPADAAEAFED